MPAKANAKLQRRRGQSRGQVALRQTCLVQCHFGISYGLPKLWKIVGKTGKTNELKKSCAVPFCDLMRAAKALKKSNESKNLTYPGADGVEERPGCLERRRQWSLSEDADSRRDQWSHSLEWHWKAEENEPEVGSSRKNDSSTLGSTDKWTVEYEGSFSSMWASTCQDVMGTKCTSLKTIQRWIKRRPITKTLKACWI